MEDELSSPGRHTHLSQSIERYRQEQALYHIHMTAKDMSYIRKKEQSVRQLHENFGRIENAKPQKPGSLGTLIFPQTKCV